jgi:hypothetical protein
MCRTGKKETLNWYLPAKTVPLGKTLRVDRIYSWPSKSMQLDLHETWHLRFSWFFRGRGFILRCFGLTPWSLVGEYLRPQCMKLGLSQMEKGVWGRCVRNKSWSTQWSILYVHWGPTTLLSSPNARRQHIRLNTKFLKHMVRKPHGRTIKERSKWLVGRWCQNAS